VASWKYAATDLLTGRVLADSLPLTVQTFSMALNGTGTLSGSLSLDQAPQVNTPLVAAVQPRRAVLWAIADGFPAWCGIVTDWPDTSRAQGTVPVTAQTLDWLFTKRRITDTLEYPQVDVFTAFTDLLRYGMTKDSGYISPVSPAVTRQPGYLAMVASQGRVARLVIPDPGTAGVPWTASYPWSDLTPVSSAWSDLCASSGVEYFFQPGLDAGGGLCCALRLGYTALGRPLTETGITLALPGNALDYGWTVTGSQGANMIWATAAPNGSAATWASQWPHGADQADLAEYPLFEDTASWQGSTVTSQAQVDGWADGQVALVTAGMTTPVIVVGAGGYPQLRDLQLGDGTRLALTSPLHPARNDGSPGVQQVVRVTGITVTAPGAQQAESYQLQTSAVTAA
jgi:hypothetical protein